MPVQFEKPTLMSLQSSPARPTSLYVTPPLELSDDEGTEDHKDLHLNSTLTPLSSLKSNTTLKQDHEQILEQRLATTLPSLAISTPPITPKDDDLFFFKPPQKRVSLGNTLQLDNGGTSPDPSSPSSSTPKRILSSPARFMKRLSMRLRSGSDVDLKRKPPSTSKNLDTRVTSPSPDSTVFDPRSNSLEQNPTTPQEDKSLKSSKSIRMKISRPQLDNLSTHEKNKSNSCIVSELGSPRKRDSSGMTLMESPLAQLSYSFTSPVNSCVTKHSQQLASAQFNEKMDLSNFDDESLFYDSTFASRDSMISIGRNSEIRNSVVQKHFSIGGESDIFRTPPQYPGSTNTEAAALDELLASPENEVKRNHSRQAIHNSSPLQSRKSHASYSTVETSPFLKLNIFLEDSQLTPPPSSRTAASSTETSFTLLSDNHDFMAIKLRKDKLQNINELVNVIIFKIINKKPNIKVNDINLSIFFKDLHLKPILLKEPVTKKNSAMRNKEVLLLDNDGLLLDYVQLKRKLYIRAQF